MSSSPFHALIGTPAPRPENLIAPYLQRNIAGHKKMIWIFVGIGIVVWLIGGTADASGGHSGSVLMSYAKALLIMAPLSMLLIGPVLLFWSVSKTSLTRLFRDGRVLLAREHSREVLNFRGSQLVKIVAEFDDESGRVQQVRFETTPQDAPPPRSELRVLRGSGTAVAVVWPSAGAVLARLL